MNKKRATDGSQQSRLDLHVGGSRRQTASKSKTENSSVPNSQIQQTDNEQSERDQPEEFFDLEAAIKRRENERAFKKEFAKDLRKLEKAKQNNSILNTEQEEEKKVDAITNALMSKSQPRGKELVLNRFLDGTLSIEEYEAHLDQKKFKNTRGHKKGANNLNKTVDPNIARQMQRLSDFFVSHN